MDHRQLLTDAARRPVATADAVLDGISDVVLHGLPLNRGNPIAWLVWHAARQMDVQLVDLTGREQVWTANDWATRLGVDRDADSFGFGDRRNAVITLRVTHASALKEYLEEVVEALIDHIETLSPEDLDDIVDRHWDPPTTRGVRIVSMIDDAIAHLGQAAYVRGLLDGWRIGY